MTASEASMQTLEICALAPVIPVLVIDNADAAENLARALVAGGLPALEVTLRTPAALDAIRAMASVEGGVVGAGTLLTPDDVMAAKDAGALFGVSPGATDRLLDAAEDADLPMLPGAATATEAFEQGAASAGLPTVTVAASELASGIGVLSAFVTAGLAASNGEARRHIKGGALRINDVVVKDDKSNLTESDLDGDGAIKLSMGKKKHVLLRPEA